MKMHAVRISENKERWSSACAERKWRDICYSPLLIKIFSRIAILSWNLKNKEGALMSRELVGKRIHSGEKDAWIRWKTFQVQIEAFVYRVFCSVFFATTSWHRPKEQRPLFHDYNVNNDRVEFRILGPLPFSDLTFVIFHVFIARFYPHFSNGKSSKMCWLIAPQINVWLKKKRKKTIKPWQNCGPGTKLILPTVKPLFQHFVDLINLRGSESWHPKILFLSHRGIIECCSVLCWA